MNSLINKTDNKREGYDNMDSEVTQTMHPRKKKKKGKEKTILTECNVCNIQLTEGNLKSHKNGKKHRKKLLNLQTMKEEEVPLENLKLYKNGKKKKKKILNQQKMKKEEEAIKSHPFEVPKLDFNFNIKVNPLSRTSSTTLSQLTKFKFQSLPISEKTKKALDEVLQYEYMTTVQAKSLPFTMNPRRCNVLAKAKTGTGKTLAFLIPCVERIHDIRKSGKILYGVSCLIISPTRELAMQIRDECQQLVTYQPFIKTQIVVGGISILKDRKKFQRGWPNILVGTPGRLIDHFTNSDLVENTANLKVLVFDEADQLLDMGFRKPINDILNFLPNNNYQKLLFSATVPAAIIKLSKTLFKGQHEYIDCVGNEENTHKHIRQEYVICDIEDQLSELFYLLQEKISECSKEYKIIVFFPTARGTQFFANIMNAAGLQVLDIHSRMTQSKRTRYSTSFRESKCGLLFSSDVSARGMDYPDVTSVIQVGLPSSVEQYVHRIGRTARIGKQGSGVLILCTFEKYIVNKIGAKIPIVRRKLTNKKFLNLIRQKTLKEPIRSVRRNTMLVGQAYQAWLGFYNSHLKKLKWSKSELVRQANAWICGLLGISEPPPLLRRTVNKMGLRGIQGLRIMGPEKTKII